MADGLKTALTLVQAAPVAEARQLDLLGAPDDADEGTDFPLVASTVRAAGPKGGRPRGRMNRSTEAWVGYIQSRYPAPLVALAETWSRPVEQLARELGLYRRGSDGKPLVRMGMDGKPLLDAAGLPQPELDLVEAFKLQQSAIVAGLPYLHSKMPQAVQVQSKERGLLQIVLGDPSDGDAHGDDLTLNIADYQEVKGEEGAHQDVGSDAHKVGR
jgi:hypothetical protein